MSFQHDHKITEDSQDVGLFLHKFDLCDSRSIINKQHKILIVLPSSISVRISSNIDVYFISENIGGAYEYRSGVALSFWTQIILCKMGGLQISQKFPCQKLC